MSARATILENNFWFWIVSTMSGPKMYFPTHDQMYGIFIMNHTYMWCWIQKSPCCVNDGMNKQTTQQKKKKYEDK